MRIKKNVSSFDKHVNPNKEVINLSILDEFSFINKITPKRSNQPHLIKGVGDDAALFISKEDVDQIVCMDTMVEDIHFNTDTMTSFDIGYKALAANISDIAAMGGLPIFYLVSIAIPAQWSEDEIVEIYRGMSSLGDQFKMDLIGGDTVSTKSKLVISVTVIGEITKGKTLLRSNAREGDIVFVTGTIGDSAAGLTVLLDKGKSNILSKEESFLVSRHQQPKPRVAIGHYLSKLERVSLNDVSDGLASELNEIAEASSVTILINETQIPLSHQLMSYNQSKATDFALYGGEDYELVGTMPQSYWDDFYQYCQSQDVPVTIIGRVISGESNVILRKGSNQYSLPKKGYNHFN
ncbi:thiamine-phosphate kinase [Bacillus timonensis]|nr:thiamine-phosphate kinase [Bacillus timonensis]